MRLHFFACIALAACAATPAPRSPESASASTAPTAIAVPANARSVVYRIDGGTMTAIGDDFESARALEGLACFDLPNGTREIHATLTGTGRVTFSEQRCNGVVFDAVSAND